MYVVAGILVVLSGLFYAAGHHEIGSLGVEMCRYGGVFCDSPHYVLTGAGLAAVWGTFVSMKYVRPAEKPATDGRGLSMLAAMLPVCR